MTAVVVGPITPSPLTELTLSNVGACTKNKDEASLTVPLVESSGFSNVNVAEKSVIGSEPSLLEISSRASKPIRSSVSCCAMTILTLAHKP